MVSNTGPSLPNSNYIKFTSGAEIAAFSNGTDEYRRGTSTLAKEVKKDLEKRT